MLQITVFVALAFSIVIAIFAVQNPTPVGVTFLWLHVDGTAVSVLVLISAALGAGVMLLLGAAREIRLRLQQRALSQQLRAAQKRIQDLESQVQTTAPAALATPSASDPTVPIAQTTSTAPPA